MRLPSTSMLLAIAAGFVWGQNATPASLWAAIKTELLSKDGEALFEANFKSALVPGDTKGVHALTGTVLSSRPADDPAEFVLAISDKVHPEVTLKLIGSHRFKGPVAAGAKISFSGIIEAFQKDPFMLTIEAGAGDVSGPTFGVIGEARGSLPSVMVNYPSRFGTKFVSINLEGLPLHKFTVDDHEMTGVRLERFLETAGWYGRLETPHYVVAVEGVQAVASFEVEGVGSFERQEWLAPTSASEAALVVMHADGTLVERVDGVRRIVVSEKR